MAWALVTQVTKRQRAQKVSRQASVGAPKTPTACSRPLKASLARRRQGVIALFGVDLIVVAAMYAHFDLAESADAFAAIAQGVLVAGVSNGGAVGALNGGFCQFVIDSASTSRRDIFGKDVTIALKPRRLWQVNSLQLVLDGD